MDSQVIYIIAQALGILGSIAFIIDFQIKNRTWFISVQLFGIILFMIQFLLLESYGGFFLNIVMFMRTLFLALSKNKYMKQCLVVTIILVVIATILNIYLKLDTHLVLFPCVACIVQSIGMCQTNSYKYRYYQIFGSSIEWLTYNIVRGSIGGIMSESFAIISSIIYLVRHRNDRT